MVLGSMILLTGPAERLKPEIAHFFLSLIPLILKVYCYVACTLCYNWLYNAMLLPWLFRYLLYRLLKSVINLIIALFSLVKPRVVRGLEYDRLRLSSLLIEIAEGEKIEIPAMNIPFLLFNSG